ncbi:MAG: MarR family transcriptional regulator [Deltaproteobacteria bacterium]|nr:MarR family transcriptional regulator [Deltaproteobacteria bacterium]MBK9369512.1 MarR family transcriptional regulator [Deltaproteobacteria bacterium]MBK9643787.1 MarR family transcriptional regulator [Deltaproteobacteria bacterium]
MNPTDLDDALRAQTSASTGQLLLRAARLLDEKALARLAAIPGAPPVRPAHTRLFPHLSFTGVRATTLARRLGVTKQAVAPLLAELVAWGLVEQVPDPADRRATLVRFTHDGLAALTHGLGLLGELEAEITAEVGAERAAVFREVLAVWVKVLSRA